MYAYCVEKLICSYKGRNLRFFYFNFIFKYQNLVYLNNDI